MPHPYQDPSRSVEERASDLLARMTLEDLVMGDRRPAARDHRHLGAPDRVAPDRRLDSAVARDAPVCNREVFALHGARLELAHEARLCRKRLRHHQQAAGVLVEAVHDARARDAGELRRVPQQGVQERALPVAAAGMHDEPRGLVHDEQRRVLEHDVERDVLRPVRDLRAFGQGSELNHLAAAHLLPGKRGAAIDGRPAGSHPAREAAAREFRQQLRERLVQSHAGAGAGRGDFHRHRRGNASAIIFGGRHAHRPL